MNAVFLIIILISFIISTWIGSFRAKKRMSRGIILFIAFVSNSVILSALAAFLFYSNIQIYHKQTSGLFGSMGIFVLLFFIPLLTLVNFYTLQFKKKGLSRYF